jgi:hypothetical protein
VRRTDGAILVDCDAGRRRGCQTFCCRLIVRLAPEERDPADPRKNCVDKNPLDGLCIHLDRETSRCRIWNARPAVCRGYDCREDPLLEVVLREGFRSLTELVTAEARPASEPAGGNDEGS